MKNKRMKEDIPKHKNSAWCDVNTVPVVGCSKMKPYPGLVFRISILGNYLVEIMQMSYLV